MTRDDRSRGGRKEEEWRKIYNPIKQLKTKFKKDVSNVLTCEQVLKKVKTE